jgi:O-antigen ligase
MTLIGKSEQNNFINISLILFVISLPFHAIEWDLFSVSRFEIKVTMITFMLLVVAWFLRFIKFERKKYLKEKLFYTFAFIYGISQFASILNSPMPEESLKQAVIISCLLIMMVIVSESISNKETAISLLTTMGIVSFVIGIFGFVYYIFFTEHSARLGNKNGDLGIIYIGGDAPYFGDLMLYSIGPVFYVILNFFNKKSWAWVKWFLLILWFSALILTYTKAIIASVTLFIIYLFFIFKKHRFFMVKTLILFVAMTIFINNQTDIKSFLINRYLNIKKDVYLTGIKGSSDIKGRLNIFSSIGMNSFMIRAKAVMVSSINSKGHFWVGNGAGLSQKLLPAMANSFDKTVDEETKKFMENFSIYGDEANKSLLDAHNLFFTEFFNVGIIGAISLLCLIALVVVEQIRIIKSSLETDNVIQLLSATLIAILFFRLASSFVVIPSLWFMLGLSFGVCKLYWSHPGTNACKEIHNNNFQFMVSD